MNAPLLQELKAHKFNSSTHNLDDETYEKAKMLIRLLDGYNTPGLIEKLKQITDAHDKQQKIERAKLQANYEIDQFIQSLKRLHVFIAVVHFKSPEWINIQDQYFRRFFSEDYALFSCLEGIDKSYYKRFSFAQNCRSKRKLISYNHAEKLNFLSKKILEIAEDGDIVIFLDSDAFPINDLLKYIRNYLKEYPLLAIRRDENDGDIQPHPCFCATTAGFWREINGDWMPGYEWKNSSGKYVTDVGGNLLEILDTRGISWHPLLRSNKKNLHPVFFGIYDDLIYHHGAGSRTPGSRHDISESKSKNLFVYGFRLLKKIAENQNRKNEILKKIASGEDFYQDLI